MRTFLHQLGVVLSLFGLICLALAILGAAAALGAFAVVTHVFTPDGSKPIEQKYDH